MNPGDPRLGPGSLLVVGQSVPRTDAVPKVTGAAQYVADIRLPGMLHAAVLRSPHPNARIASIDTSAAQRLRRESTSAGLCPMLVRDQLILQWTFIVEGLEQVETA